MLFVGIGPICMLIDKTASVILRGEKQNKRKLKMFRVHPYK